MNKELDALDIGFRVPWDENRPSELYTPVVLSIEYSLENKWERMNYDLSWDHIPSKIPDRAFEDAWFGADIQRDFYGWDQLMAMKQKRRQHVKNVFGDMARRLLDKIEKEEPWEEFSSKIGSSKV